MFILGIQVIRDTERKLLKNEYEYLVIWYVWVLTSCGAGGSRHLCYPRLARAAPLLDQLLRYIVHRIISGTLALSRLGVNDDTLLFCRRRRTAGGFKHDGQQLVDNLSGYLLSHRLGLHPEHIAKQVVEKGVHKSNDFLLLLYYVDDVVDKVLHRNFDLSILGTPLGFQKPWNNKPRK